MTVTVQDEWENTCMDAISDVNIAVIALGCSDGFTYVIGDMLGLLFGGYSYQCRCWVNTYFKNINRDSYEIKIME